MKGFGPKMLLFFLPHVGNVLSGAVTRSVCIHTATVCSRKRERDQEGREVVKRIILNNGAEPVIRAYENIETTVVVQDFVETEDGQLIVYIDNDAAQAFNASSEEEVTESINDAIESVISQSKSADHVREAIEAVIQRVCHPRNSGMALGCELCPRVFTNKASLRFHMVAHQRKGNVCPHCNASYKRLDHLHKHIQAMHPNTAEAKEIEEKPVDYNPYAKSYQCEVCSKVLKSPIAYENHVLRHQGDTPYKCDHCSQMFRKRGERRRHEVKEHNIIQKENGNLDGYNICEECGMEFFSDGGYYHHKMKHGEPVPCHVCGKTYASRSLMMFHAKRHTEERPFKCTLCEKSFKVRPELRAHMRVHNDIRPYQCPHCPRTCRKSSDLTHHVRTHTGEKPFVCGVCSRGFAQAGDMRKHYQLHFRPSKLNRALKAEVEVEVEAKDDGVEAEMEVG